MSRYFDRATALMNAYGGYQEKRKVEFEQTTNALVSLPGPAAGGGGPVEYNAERLRPARPPSLESDWLVPLAWAGTLGTLAFGLALYAALVYGWLWHLSCVASMVVMAITFLAGIRALQKTLWLTERISHRDLNGDGYVGEPAAELTVSVRDDKDRVRQQYIADVGVGPEKLVEFCKGVLSGKGLTVGGWTGKNNLFSRSEYDRLMAELERSKMVERDGSGPNAPRKLTHAGTEAFTQLATEGK